MMRENINLQNKIYCIIPAFNEEKNIYEVVRSVRRFVFNVIVVDDCSTDNTAKIAEHAGAIVLRHPVNLDQGAALRTGNNYALDSGAEIIIHFDADGQFLAKEIPEIITPIISDRADIVFGSRFLGKRANIPFLKRFFLLPIARFVNLLFFNIKLTDPQSGFRAMNKKAAQIINIEQDGKAHCSEIIYKSFQNNLRVKEVPITVVYREFGQNLKGGINIIKDFIINKLVR